VTGPTITQQPTAQSVCTGLTAAFTAAASGSGTLSYQWQKNSVNVTNGGHYSGCTTTTLTIASSNSSDVASYRCVVTDSSGSTNSNQAALALKAATTITQHPVDKAIALGQTATFTVTAVGDGTLAYQWQKDGSNITNGGHYSGCTAAMLTISSAGSGEAGNYRCVVAGGCGGATSDVASLSLGVPGDFDTDGDVDLEDFSVLQACFTGLFVPILDPACLRADLSSDGYVEVDDLSRFRDCLSGADIPANAACVGP
jgi:hypothetical protein